MRLSTPRRLALAVCCFALATISAGSAAPQGKPLHADLSGSNEVPIAGDPDGTGRAVIRVNPGQGTVCYEITYENIATALAGHIHIGAAGVPGGIVVHLPPTAGVFSGCED
ncbi:unnamed protein product, partial [Phaeothamnion confervicola]